MWDIKDDLRITPGHQFWTPKGGCGTFILFLVTGLLMKRMSLLSIKLLDEHTM